MTLGILPFKECIMKKAIWIFGDKQANAAVTTCSMLLPSATKWKCSTGFSPNHIQSIEFPTGGLQSRRQGHQMVFVFHFCHLFFFFSIKPRRKRLNRLQGQDNVAAPTYNLWEWSDLTFEDFFFFFVCFRVAKSLKDGFITRRSGQCSSVFMKEWRGHVHTAHCLG